MAYQVWLLHFGHYDSSTTHAIGQTQGSKSLYQIGKELRLVKSCMPVVTDDAKKAAMLVNGMKVAVLRMLTRASNLAVNAAVGVFPSVQAPAEPILWKRIAQQRMNEAITKGLWRPLFNENEVLNVQQLDDGLLI